MTKEKLSYKKAGVDIDAGEQLVENIKPLAAKTRRDGLLGGIGGFGALFQIPEHYKSPILVTGTDGVGTKLKLATELNKHDTIGCALIGGETAEMPGMYAGEEYDLAGFAVGAVEKERLISGSGITKGDVILGLGSSGAHSNGYSLIRKVIAQSETKLDDLVGGEKLGDLLIEPTRIYVRSLLNVIKTGAIKGLAHITGGGLIENIPRILPKNLVAEIDPRSWPRSELFAWLQENGNIDSNEMLRVFNCGIGMVIVCEKAEVNSLKQMLESTGETVFIIGNLTERLGTEHQTKIVHR